MNGTKYIGTDHKESISIAVRNSFGKMVGQFGIETKANRMRRQVRRDLLAESKKHKPSKRLCQIPSMGPIRAARLLGILQTPDRFRTKRQLSSYCGFGIEMHSRADHEVVRGQLRRKKKAARPGPN